MHIVELHVELGKSSKRKWVAKRFNKVSCFYWENMQMQTIKTQTENVLQPDVSFGRKTCAYYVNTHKLLFSSESEWVHLYLQQLLHWK